MSGKLIAWMIATMGLGVSVRYAIPALIIGIFTMAQGDLPSFNFKELAGLGGFVVFSAFMAWLYVKERRESREERKEWMQAFTEHGKTIDRNTQATNQQTLTLQALHQRGAS